MKQLKISTVISGDLSHIHPALSFYGWHYEVCYLGRKQKLFFNPPLKHGWVSCCSWYFISSWLIHHQKDCLALDRFYDQRIHSAFASRLPIMFQDVSMEFSQMLHVFSLFSLPNLEAKINVWLKVKVSIFCLAAAVPHSVYWWKTEKLLDGKFSLKYFCGTE